MEDMVVLTITIGVVPVRIISNLKPSLLLSAFTFPTLVALLVLFPLARQFSTALACCNRE